MKRFFTVVFSFALFAGTLCAELVPEKIYLLANANEPESIALAEFYCEKRGVPAKNIIAVDAPAAETVRWDDFAKIHEQLLRELISRGLLKKVVPGNKKAGSRYAPVVYLPGTKIDDVALGEKIDCLVICRGIPLRVEADEKLLPPRKTDENGVPAPRDPLQMNCGSVDGELAVIALAFPPEAGPAKNPYFKNAAVPAMQKLIVRVARLDGPSWDCAKRIVAGSIAAELAGGPAGRAYIDKGGPWKQGEVWFDETAAVLRELGFDLTVDSGKSLLGQTTRYDAPAFYFGWYARHASGFVEDPSFYFPAGAIAFHLHSFSATSLRDRKEWCAALIDRGAAATFGNVYEPYLGFSLMPQILMRGLADGKQLGEAVFEATPAVGWQNVFVGDPLYRPFSGDAGTQIYNQQKKAKIESAPLAQYIFIRAINFAALKNDVKNLNLFERELKLFAPGLAGQFFEAKKRTETGGRSAWAGPNLAAMHSENVGLLLETARWLAEHDREKEAAEIYGEVLKRSRGGLLPKNRKPVLEEAVRLVKKHNLTGTCLRDWLEELEKK